ncbi:MAG: glutamate--tRNA ligase family protein [Alphaproteobacteria bacterium]|nr:glutamate--tRNA ligase family protein [Alphaproteobacteria bacterium]MDA8008950.1 glutamate--tRNA ligase family protein [Alphaproteobacteria bacterium]
MLRFAPTPSGLLHCGNARVALLNWLRARQTGADFLLRFDDTAVSGDNNPAAIKGDSDTAAKNDDKDDDNGARELSEAIETDLRWLGLDWDRTERQSARAQLYEDARTRLVADGRLYPCYETPDELEAMRREAKERGRAFTYDRARALDLTPADRAQFEREGRVPHWRFRLSGGEVSWADMSAGEKSFNLSSLSDPVVARADGRVLYLLASAVDDIETGVSEVVRGADHVVNTAVQIDIVRALGGEVPKFAHIPLVRTGGGEDLSKRAGASDWTLAALRGAGVEPLALACYLSRLGTGVPMEPVGGIGDLVEDFDLGLHGGGAPRLDRRALSRLSSRTLHGLEWSRAEARLRDEGISGVDEGMWRMVSGNLTVLDDIRYWVSLGAGDLSAPDVDEGGSVLARVALSTLTAMDESVWQRDSDSDGDGDGAWNAWRELLEEASGLRGRNLMVPLRLLLTGRRDGPEFGALLGYYGRSWAINRLQLIN